VPQQGIPDTTFNAFFTQNGPGWTGADGTFSLPLPDGRELWMWSDTFVGTVDPVSRLRSFYLFQAHNSLTIQDWSTNSLLTVGYPPKTTSYFTPANTSAWFWIGDGIVVHTSPGTYKIKVILLEWTGSFRFLGNSVATLAWPSLAIESIQPVPLSPIQWGARILKDGEYYYIYGIKDPGTFNKLPYVARIKPTDSSSNSFVWSFWNGNKNSWVASLADATPLQGVPAITNEYSVSKLTTSKGTFYLMVGMDPTNYRDITTYYSCNPQGPWTNRTVAYATPETGFPGCHVGRLWSYNARAHAEFINAEGILISYNVNALDSHDLICADDYKPRFIRVWIAGLISGK